MRRPGALLEWFWRGQALRRFEAAPPGAPRRAARLRARVAKEAGDQVLRAYLGSGSPAPAALSLYRECLSWCLQAEGVGTWSPSSRLPGLLEADEREAVRSALVDADFATVAAWSDAHVQTIAVQVQRAMERLLAGVNAAMPGRRSLVRERWMRTATGLVVLLGLAGGLVSALTGPVELAGGRPMRWSSPYPAGGPRSGILRHLGPLSTREGLLLFHTQTELQAWMEIDLGRAERVSQIDVRNRADCCQERAVPLLVEVSTNRRAWRVVARRDAVFDRWVAHVPAVRARYVRLRLVQANCLHLEDVFVYR